MNEATETENSRCPSRSAGGALLAGEGQTKARKSKCSVKDGKFVEPCTLLAEATEYGHPRGRQKGVFAWAYSSTQGPTRTMFGAKSGQRVQDGLLFNFCPFCGERIDEPFSS